MAKAITLNDIMRKLEDIDQSIAQMQFDLDNMAKEKETPTKRKPLKAKDFPIGAKVTTKHNDMVHEVIGHGKISDNVLCLEDEEGDIFTENCEDVKIYTAKQLIFYTGD